MSMLITFVKDCCAGRSALALAKNSRAIEIVVRNQQIFFSRMKYAPGTASAQVR